MIVALLAAWPAGAQADACRDEFGVAAPGLEWDSWLADLERRSEGDVMRRTMTVDERLRFLWTYNRTPPLTDVNPQRIELFTRAHLPTMVVVFVEDGCVTLTAVMFRALVESVISPNTRERDRGFDPHDSEA